ncbi:MAG TPA: bifunctional metallophosphatase/5'-nucleotidase [Syntrophales bacterium]|nr:bifunctional metallophosphatase/5'-nucleotidase [Syntrophales bacterium]HPO36197.1 bifunctional metallophosphatase/5'-nucleotidase [Syntrophales bacterium]
MKVRGWQIVLALTLLLNFSVIAEAQDFPLTLVHINDTHSHLESEWVTLKVKGTPVSIPAGGFARLKTLVNEWRTEDPHLLFLHAGDVVQGTLYFTLFDGSLEFSLLNDLKPTCMVMGNHEFDRGVKVLPGWIRKSRFPWVASNIDFSGEPEIAALVKPYLIKKVKGEKIGIIGLTTEKTPFMALNVGKTVFEDPVETTRKYVSLLTKMGVNKIIVLSHLGYARDCELAARVTGIDVIVGGHSHSLLGPEESLSPLGLMPEGPYPTVIRAPDGEKVLVVQAWRWAQIVGKLEVYFSPEGEVKDYRGSLVLPAGTSLKEGGRTLRADENRYREFKDIIWGTGIVKTVKEDREILKKIAPFGAKIEKYKRETVTEIPFPLTRGLNRPLGNLVADAMRDKFPGAQIALYNSGGVRRNLPAGKISLSDVAEVLPFGNTLFLLDLTGKELKDALEGGIAFLIRERGQNPDLLPYVSGMKMEVDFSAPTGERVKRLFVERKDGQYVTLDFQATYRVVVNSFMAAGGDGFTLLRAAKGFRQDTGIYDRDALIEFLKKNRSWGGEKEERVKILSAEEKGVKDAFGRDNQKPPTLLAA